MTGGEALVEWLPAERWHLSSALEYVYNQNSRDHYPLPFSPPTVITTDVTYTGDGRGALTQYILQLEHRGVMAQDRIAKNESRTPGTSLWNLSAHLHWRINGRQVVVDFQIDNLFDRAFLNHLSFYRRLNAPEPGRNGQVIVRFPF